MGEFERKPFDDIGTDTNIPADSEREFSAKIADVDIRDDFKFSYVMCNPQICMELLQYQLPDHKISRIEYYEMGRDGTEQPAVSSQRGEPLKLDIQKSLNEAFNRRTVRLDVYIDDGKSVYNLEMQTTRHAGLAKRARLYQAHMDINQLQRGQFYTRLRPSFVIFICTFDPFDEGRYLYSFRSVCRETGAELGDEAYWTTYQEDFQELMGLYLMNHLNQVIQELERERAEEYASFGKIFGMRAEQRRDPEEILQRCDKINYYLLELNENLWTEFTESRAMQFYQRGESLAQQTKS